ncbi:hypothetical protein L596_026188 [Steinernema carpocapsae]|uniref:Lysozyme n=1 Tax=Steinernema carpocapsae TaxID=34508 RepID=A0A4U5M0N9_STECR|nr:hypothetical protein L596_026188 [Steinernema carpocapsae]
MKPLLLLGLFVVSQGKAPSSDVAYGVDLKVETSQNTFQCLRNLGYTYAFVAVYNPKGEGAVYPYAARNVFNATQAGFKIHTVQSPAPTSSKSGAAQFQEVFGSLKSAAYDVYSIILQITSPISWPNDPQRNVAFITDYLNAAEQANVHVAIYTNWYDWEQITGDWQTTPRLLWYWNTNGNGEQAAGTNDFTDFRNFGGFTASNALGKQYIRKVNACGIVFNKNRLSTRSTF